jgi:hypothetical protein
MSCIACPPNVAPDLVRRLKGLAGEVREYLNSQHRRSNVSVELEVRLGHIAENGNFLADVGATAWARIKKAIDASPIWGVTLRERESVDFFFPAENGTAVRSSRSISREGAIVLEHTQKNKVRACTFSVDHAPDLLTGARVAFSTESAMGADELPEIVETTDRVRIKHRCTYQWKNWTFDLTRAWTANDYLHAVALRDDKETDHASYEVEIELEDAASYFEKQFHTDEYVAVSLLMKVLGLLPKNIAVR